MKSLSIRGKDFAVNYTEELEPYYDKFYKYRIRGDKLQACSPFRMEKHPSFAVNLENGSWIDSGADEEENRKGSFISLLAHLREESEEDAKDYLIEKYGHYLDNTSKLHLKFNFQLEDEQKQVIAPEEYKDILNKPSGYLLKRGIKEKTQKFFKCGFDEEKGCVAIPWEDEKGNIINIKYRSVTSKKFWYHNGNLIENMLFGLFAVKRFNYKTVWAVESETDALYLWSNGIPAIAFGMASINEKQKELLLNTNIGTLVVATDNDTVGHRFAKVLQEEFGGIFNLKRINFPKNRKDINDLSIIELEECKNHLQNFNLFVNI